MKFEEKNKVIYCKNKYYKKFNNGEFYYIKNGLQYFRGYLVHRDNGPAVEHTDGTKFWYKEGKYHREDGPAVEWPDEKNWWYLNGIPYDEKEHNKIMSIKNKKWIFDEI